MSAAQASQHFDEEHDVVVVGSGAGGMAAALTAAHHGLDVLVIEKTDSIGGSTAVSGGAVWIPMNPHSREVGVEDSREAVLAYLQAILGNRMRRDMIDAFLDAGPRMVSFMESNTALRFVPRAVSPDYQSNLEGASTGGRTIDPAPFDGRELGENFNLLRNPIAEFLVFGGMMVGRKDIDSLLGIRSSWANFRDSTKLLLRYGLDRLRYPRGTRLLMGNALAGRLLKSALDRKIPLRTRTAAAKLLLDGPRVVGLEVERDGLISRIGARRGVVLATGGFPANAAMQADMLPHADQHYSMAPIGNTGDGLKLAREAGASIETDNVGNAFWTPVSVMRDRDGRDIRFPHLILDRQKPGVIAVNHAGRRFVNEAISYHEFVEAMHRAHESEPTIPAYLVCDASFLRNYGLGLVRPAARSLSRFLDSGYLVAANTVAELARKLGVDAVNLAASVAQMNQAAASGHDPAFGKGSTAYNRYLGDPAHQPNPCLGPIETPPFYAVRVFPGDIGTAAGLKTDAKARVLDDERRPIPGLFASGNDMNSIMAGAYPGAGITLGPALTFGYIAGLELANATHDEAQP
ncbi:FAD-dependent oxidoreductase [Bradyrhizobium sp. Cp5.3]|uniref:FAD-dependent oxidoreductase n=1 Tax=Bradyrhizobium sp. Cp5.3 TaxID=443598 RepID=UPI00041C2956|nr:FAD-dependent oxidoreductase [Bradyrhizobium sp. Cp5.3]